MDHEYQSLIENGTWKLVERSAIYNFVFFKWNCKTKEEQGSNIMLVNRYNAQLVERGFSQIERLDYHKTFSALVKFLLGRVILPPLARKDLHFLQMDVATAFLNGDLLEDVYVEQLPGYEKMTQDESSVNWPKLCMFRNQPPNNGTLRLTLS